MKNLNSLLRIISILGFVLCGWSAAYGQITPSQDSYTNSAAPTANFGASALLNVSGATEISYVQFNLSSIPSGASISQATLKLYVSAVATAGSFNVDYVSGSWAESTITHNLSPALGSTIASGVQITLASKNQYILINVTSAVEAWLNGSQANDGIALVADGTFNASFDSKENTTTSHSPELDISFAGGNGTITGVTTSSGSGLTGGGTTGTLNLGLTSSCAASQVLQWNGSAWACASAGTGTISSVTAGTDLIGGGTGGNVTLSLNTAATDGRYAQLGGNNTLTGTQTFTNTTTITGSNGAGALQVTGSSYESIVGTNTWIEGTAVRGVASATSGGAVGVVGTSASSSGFGVNGASPNVGILGTSSGTANTSSGVQGTSPVIGVLGSSTGSAGFGVEGTGSNVGILGTSSGTANTSSGVQGTSPVIGVLGNSTGSAGFGVEGTGSNVGVYGNGGYGVVGYGSTVGVQGFATKSGGLSGLFQGGQLSVAGNGNSALIGDPGCNAGFAGIGLTTGSLSGCTNFTLIGKTTGDVYLNSTSSGAIHFRNNNGSTDLAAIDNSGNLTVKARLISGAAIGSATASSFTVASTSDCVLPLSVPNSNCLTPNMTLTVTTSGGPVLIMASLGGVNMVECVDANFYLAMDNQIVSTNMYGFPGGESELTATMMSLLTPGAGTHTFQVQESDDASMCSSGDYYQTTVSLGNGGGWLNPTRTLIVREF